MCAINGVSLYQVPCNQSPANFNKLIVCHGPATIILKASAARTYYSAIIFDLSASQLTVDSKTVISSDILRLSTTGFSIPPSYCLSLCFRYWNQGEFRPHFYDFLIGKAYVREELHLSSIFTVMSL